MSEITLIPYSGELFDEWNLFVENSNEGTIFHNLNFLSYHGERFKTKEHHITWRKGKNLFSVMPMAIIEQNGIRVARSPYGASYGGPIFTKPLNYNDSQIIVKNLLDYLISLSIDKCIITLPVYSCYGQYSDTFRLTLLENGFRCNNRDISSIVCLDNDNSLSEIMLSKQKEIARKARKAQTNGVTTVKQGNIQDFWIVLEATFKKLQIQPTHNLDELQWFLNNLPHSFHVNVAYFEEQPIAGIGHFRINERVITSFYLCQNPEFQNKQGLSLLIYESLQQSQTQDYKWFDFGTSSINMHGRENLFRFKESFGAVGFFRETYLWEK